MNADGTNQRNLTRSPGLAGWLVRAIVVTRWKLDPLSERGRDRARANRSRAAQPRRGGILVQAALLAGFALVALRHGPLPFGALTLLLFAPTALMTVVSEEYRFLPGALLAGLLADLLVRRFPYGSARRTDAVIAFAVPAGFYAAYFATLLVTSGVGWTVHLWLGAILIAGIIGLALDEVMRAARPASPSAEKP